MKRVFIIASIILAIIAGMIGVYHAGIHHAIVDAEIWVEDETNDYLVHIVIDGNEYLHVS